MSCTWSRSRPAVREAGAALVMAAYNVVNGSRMTEHATLLGTVLKGEWGFAGLVTSDWDATRSTVPTAVGGLDLAMPGPNRYWGQALADAVRAGQVPEEMVDDKLARLLGVARRVGALSEAASRGSRRATAPASPRAPDLVPAALLRRAVTGSLVLLHTTARCCRCAGGTAARGAGRRLHTARCCRSRRAASTGSR